MAYMCAKQNLQPTENSTYKQSFYMVFINIVIWIPSVVSVFEHCVHKVVERLTCALNKMSTTVSLAYMQYFCGTHFEKTTLLSTTSYILDSIYRYNIKVTDS